MPSSVGFVKQNANQLAALESSVAPAGSEVRFNPRKLAFAGFALEPLGYGAIKGPEKLFSDMYCQRTAQKREESTLGKRK